MYYGDIIVQYLVFPGMLFTAVVGLVTSWIDRKVTARVQMRVGPPFLQPFYDIVKYMIKETTVPAGAPAWLFLSAPLIGLAAVSAASTILWRALMVPSETFAGDLIVLIYLLTMPALAVILGSFASCNPLASVGGSREMKLVMGYELPFVLAALVPVIHAQSIRMGDILSASPAVAAPSGVLALLVAMLCMQAKLTLVPFDAPEAETELTGGAYIEYSGPPLGLFKLTRAMMLFTMPMFLVALYCGGIRFGTGWLDIVLGILKYVGLVVVIVLIRNTAPRMRIDQAVKFFWGPVTVVALAAVVLAFMGW
ncbi:MAG: NADH-quinone oxidoreductase subunit H [Verrucomicrobia bacterium]|nr:NADH-quinone oxidoreductase subunit H [Verrucomicrobiota bacterium]MBU1909019.1 NADH-quinone oxidoreductase subunit H [Verrucomicrobiota bacterium]